MTLGRLVSFGHFVGCLLHQVAQMKEFGHLIGWLRGHPYGTKRGAPVVGQAWMCDNSSALEDL
eukprot:6299918-Amphidinium_carterae.1